MVTVGIDGSRIKDPAAVSNALMAAGASAAQVQSALAAASVHPTYFEPVFTLTQARFEQLGGQSSALYRIAGTVFQPTTARTVITPGLAAHVVGTVGPVTAEELQQLGPPYDADQHRRPNRARGGLPDAAGRQSRRHHQGGRRRRQDRRHGRRLSSQAGDRRADEHRSGRSAGRRSGSGPGVAIRGPGGGPGLHRPGAGGGECARGVPVRSGPGRRVPAGIDVQGDHVDRPDREGPVAVVAGHLPSER